MEPPRALGFGFPGKQWKPVRVRREMLGSPAQPAPWHHLLQLDATTQDRAGRPNSCLKACVLEDGGIHPQRTVGRVDEKGSIAWHRNGVCKKTRGHLSVCFLSGGSRLCRDQPVQLQGRGPSGRAPENLQVGDHPHASLSVQSGRGHMAVR